MNSTVKDQNIIKIIIMGLDNSGKSSILLSFREDTNLLSYFSLYPTKGVSIENLISPQSNMIIWEFGGQERYREDHIKNLNKYLKDIDKIIFVIDIQDIERYDLALDYFMEIMSILEKFNIKVDISIYLHKYDPNLTKQEKFKDLDKIITPNLINKIENLIPSEYICSFYKTSIYTIFEKFLIK
ncbi:MAG: ADP-ribosylation factor-like protein [Promethearchaeota archaeon]